tara:strand:+ start:321 stop:671 length:351 start_codon:yes stop_codon:yes gene_type:complete
MGYTKHHAIIVSGWYQDDVKQAHAKAIQIFNRAFQNESKSLISDIMPGIMNGYSSFFIAPDGSKEDWPTSDNGDIARKEFLDWILMADKHLDYIEVIFGGDSDQNEVIRSFEIDTK